MFILIFLTISYACSNHQNGTFRISPSITFDELAEIMEILTERVGHPIAITGIERICDGCGKTIDINSDSLNLKCKSCGTTFDLCTKCVNSGKLLNQCPKGYGCKNN